MVFSATGGAPVPWTGRLRRLCAPSCGCALWAVLLCLGRTSSSVGRRNPDAAASLVWLYLLSELLLLAVGTAVMYHTATAVWLCFGLGYNSIW